MKPIDNFNIVSKKTKTFVSVLLILVLFSITLVISHTIDSSLIRSEGFKPSIQKRDALDLSSSISFGLNRLKRSDNNGGPPASAVDQSKNSNANTDSAMSDVAHGPSASAVGAGNKNLTSAHNVSSTALDKNCDESSKNGTCVKETTMTGLENLYENSGMLFRGMIVLLGVTAIVVVYFVIKSITLRRRRSKSRKYGIVAQHGGPGDMEMEPLGDGDDDDDDYTVFEMNGRRK